MRVEEEQFIVEHIPFEVVIEIISGVFFDEVESKLG